MKLVIGEGNCSAVTVSSLSRQFSSAGLEGKLANFSEEEPISCFKETGELKKITGNSPVFVENKFEKGYTMVNRAKIIMSYNKVPYLGDTSYGMRRRLLIVPCDHNYEELPETKIKDLYTKIQEELPAILNRALTALERLRRRGGFLEVEETASIVTEMVHDSDAVQEWFDYYIVPDTENNICFKDAYNNFKNEMELGKDSKLISFRGFCKRLRDICREKKIEIDARKKIIKGYSLNEPEEEF
jgi:putative DNA primase/helicase